METQVLGLSVDSVDSLRAWAESLGGITYPLLSDFFPHGAVARMYGVLRNDGRAERALFVIDKAGQIRYVDVHDIEDQPDNEVLFAEIAKVEPGLASEWAAKDAAQPVASRPEADVVLYCTSWCPNCKVARPWLEEHGVEYTEIDISADRAAAARVRQLTGGNETTPTFDIRGTIVAGWDLDAVARALGVKK